MKLAPSAAAKILLAQLLVKDVEQVFLGEDEGKKEDDSCIGAYRRFLNAKVLQLFISPDTSA